MHDFLFAVGVIGVSFLLVAFVLNLFKRISADSLVYNAFNVIGAGCLAYYAYILESWPFVALEIIWGLFAAYKILFRK